MALQCSASLLRIGIAVCCAVLGSSALARLGDTEKQIFTLYGKPIKTPTRDEEGVITKIYRVKNYFILVELEEGKSISEAYGHMDGTPLYNKEISAFLDVNSDGKTWGEKLGSKKRWDRSDKGAEAVYLNLGGQSMLWIRSKVEDDKLSQL